MFTQSERVIYFRPRWRTQVVCLTLSFLIVGVLFITRAWFGILLLKTPQANRFVEEHINDAKIATWLRRARMYAESTKENQNADRNTSISTSEQYHRDTTGWETLQLNMILRLLDGTVIRWVLYFKCLTNWVGTQCIRLWKDNIHTHK